MVLIRPNLPARAGRVLATSELLDAGHTRSSIAAAARTGALEPLRFGRWWIRPAAEDLRPGDLERARLIAAIHDALDAGRELILAGQSAALWWGLPWVGPMSPATTVVGRPRDGAGSRGLLRRLGGVPDEDIVRHESVLVTSPARTVIDVARSSPSRTGLVVADAALHHTLTSLEELVEQAASLAGFRGIARARWCVAHANGLAESPGESISRHAMIEAGLPMPELQFEFTLPDGRRVWVDFFWEHAGLVGEFDGECKYLTGERGRAAADVVLAEKWREDGLRELGNRMIRWSWADAWRPGAWIERLRALLV